MSNQQPAPEALRVEAAYGGDGKFIGYRLLASGANGGLLVWADQKAMPGFRIGDHFVPDYREVIDYKPVSLVEAQQPSPTPQADSGAPPEPEMHPVLPGGEPWPHYPNLQAGQRVRVHTGEEGVIESIRNNTKKYQVLIRPGYGGQYGSWEVTPIAPTPQADSQPAPIDMVLHCPACGLQHIDAAEPELGPSVDGSGDMPLWANPPHRSHLCHGCGHIWRPADVPTNGVKAVKTTGKADSPIAARKQGGAT